MQIDLKALIAKGKEKQNFSFTYSASKDIVDIPYVSILGDVKVSGSVDITSAKKAYVTADIEYTLAGACSRCGRQTEQTVCCALDELFTDSDTENDAYTFEKGVIDLTKAVDDAIVMSLPMQVLCKNDCKGICQKCGQNLNDGDCGCE